MKKLWLCGLFGMAILIASQAFARVCFLSDTECQERNFASEESCDDAKLTHEWDKLKCYIYAATPACNDDKGNWYGITGCTGSYPQLDNNHYCLEGSPCIDNPKSDLDCCPTGKHRCKDKSHGGNWHVCQNNSHGEGNSCEDDQTSSGNKKYQKCICDRNKYKYACSSCGNLTGSGESCTDDEGHTYYVSCQCAAGSTEVSTSSINCSNCTEQMTAEVAPYPLIVQMRQNPDILA